MKSNKLPLLTSQLQGITAIILGLKLLYCHKVDSCQASRMTCILDSNKAGREFILNQFRCETPSIERAQSSVFFLSNNKDTVKL